MNRKKKKKQADNQGDTEEVDHEEEQQAVEEEIETREAEVEEASIMMQDMEQIENDLNSLQDDSDEHPFKANGIDICALAESLIKGFSPLETLTKAELASIVAKIEADCYICTSSWRNQKIIQFLFQEIGHMKGLVISRTTLR